MIFLDCFSTLDKKCPGEDSFYFNQTCHNITRLTELKNISDGHAVTAAEEFFE